MTAFWFVVVLSVGVLLGFGLFAALTVAGEEQRKVPRGLPMGLHPLESDTRF